jgi:thiosulfate/3-mercaptopyruvate sulfurtransferase
MVLSEVLGYPSVRNYDGSWEEWSQFDSLPAAVGDEFADAAGKTNAVLEQLENKQ